MGATVPLPVGGAESHLTQCSLGLGLSLYQVASYIYPTVWPQYTDVTDRQARHRHDRQWSFSIRRTILHTVTQKPTYGTLLV